MKITITESKWAPTFLLREDGKQCCIGQTASQCGASDESMRGRRMMSAAELHLDERMSQKEIPHALAGEFSTLTNFNLSSRGQSMKTGPGPVTQIKSFIGYVNDAYHRETDKSLRKRLKDWLVRAFAECGYELEFVA